VQPPLPGADIEGLLLNEEGKQQGSFKFDLEIIEFCPKSVISVSNQGINR
jgi:hypothetical protein